ncbi:hypothetical protein D3C84_998550 [compost metagenome]
MYGTVLHLLAGGDRDRARYFGQCRIRLGSGCRALGQVALHRAPGVFSVCFHAYHGHQGVGSAALFQLQSGAAQGFAQGAGSIELAFDRGRSLARRQRRVQRQRKTSLAGNLVQGAGQRSGR